MLCTKLRLTLLSQQGEIFRIALKQAQLWKCGKPCLNPRISQETTENPFWRKSSRSIAMKSFLAGLGIGIGLGILFAPMSGEDTRNNLTQRASDLAGSARDLVEQSRDRVRSTVSAIRGQAERFTGAVQEATGTEAGRNL